MTTLLIRNVICAIHIVGEPNNDLFLGQRHDGLLSKVTAQEHGRCVEQN